MEQSKGTKGGFRTILKHTGSRVWLIVTSILLVLAIVANIAIYGFLPAVFSSVFGGAVPMLDTSVKPVYISAYDSKESVFQAANDLNERIAEEGFVLLKNKDNALPIYTPLSNDADKRPPASPKISVFGKNSVNPVYGGSGSGGGSGAGAISIYASLRDAGYDLNPQLESFYNDKASGPERPASPEGSNLDDGVTIGIPTYETPVALYSDALIESFNEYKDAAIVVISRMGGEGFDLPRVMTGTDGARSVEGQADHYLQLDQNETDLLKMVCGKGFGKVVLVLNVGTSMEMGFLEEVKDEIYNELKGYDFDASKIDAAIWTGFPGNSGFAALGRILNGNVNPSGRTTDTWTMDFKQDPSWNNFGDNRTADGNQYISNGSPQSYYFVDYEESIYVGYRYYETRGYVEEQNGNAAWYGEHVVYPFGYGLSYSEFSWKVVDASQIKNVDISANPFDTEYEITVEVTNHSSVAGRDVVQLYGHAPWDEWGEIEKPHTVLLDFAKTDLIEPGGTDTVTLVFNPYYLASFDYKDGNYNGFFGYELEPLEGYELRIGRNAHETVETIPFEVFGEMLFAYDPITGAAVEVRFSGNENAYLNSDLGLNTTLSRVDFEGTFPTSPTSEERAVVPGMIAALEDRTHNNPNEYTELHNTFNAAGSTRFRDLITGADSSYVKADYEDERFDELIDQCSASELLDMINYGAFKSDGLLKIGKPLTNDTDGPAGFVNFMLMDGTYYDTCYYASQMTIASTWSKELARAFGEMVGDEGIVGAAGKGNKLNYSGWYAPGMNIHRSPFGGRNFEYMSEDGLFTGKMAAAQISGCQSRGVYTFMKHFAANEQETRRSIGGLVTWLTEQSLREVYLRAFEIAIKEGGASAVMTSFNRIGTRWTGGDYRLLTNILREEWGFHGTVITDFTSGPYMDAKQMHYAGGSLNLNNQEQYAWTSFDAANAADVEVLRRAAHDVFYTVVNSNAMNYDITGYSRPVWSVFVIAVDAVLLLGLAAWGVFAIRKAGRAEK